MIVADTNLIVYLLIDSPFTAQAQKIFRFDDDWVAPPLWRSEFCNVLTCYNHKGLIELEIAKKLLAKAEQLIRKPLQTSTFFPNILNLAFESGCSSYDCEFIFLAMELGIPLITQDKKMLSRFPHITYSIEKYSTSA